MYHYKAKVDGPRLVRLEWMEEDLRAIWGRSDRYGGPRLWWSILSMGVA